MPLVSFLPASGLWAARQHVKRNKPWLLGGCRRLLPVFRLPHTRANTELQTVRHFFSVRDDFGMNLRMGNGPEAQGTWLKSQIPSQNPAQVARNLQIRR